MRWGMSRCGDSYSGVTQSWTIPTVATGWGPAASFSKPSSIVPSGNPSCRGSSGLCASPWLPEQLLSTVLITILYMWCFQPFNGAFIRCWINCFSVLSESWRIKLWHRVLSTVLSTSQNLALTVLLWLQKADSAALSLVHLPHNQNGVIARNKPRLGHRCLKAATRAKCLGLKAVRDMILICAVWDWKHHRAQLKDFFLSYYAYVFVCNMTVRNLFLQQTF